MAFSELDRNRSDGRFIGSKTVSSPDAWTDCVLSSLASSTSTALPADIDRTAVDLFVYNASEDDAYLLLRPHGSQGDEVLTGALIIPAGQGRALACYLPDSPIQTVAVHGTVRIDAIMI